MGRKTALWGWVFLLIAMSIAAFYYVAQKQPGRLEGKERPIAGEEARGGAVHEKENKWAERSELQIEEVILQYLGHACFLLEADGLQILMDPYSPEVGYGKLSLDTQIVTISHEHRDHNYAAASPRAKILRGLTTDGLGWDDVSFTEGSISIASLPSYHDAAGGKQRGRNAAFIFNLGSLRIVHLGDLGHLLSEGDVEKLKPVDILLVPVGGHYTLDAREAREVIAQLSPAVAIPMHYQTKVTRSWPLADLKPFLAGEGKIVEKGKKPQVFKRDQLPPKTEIWIMEASKPAKKS